MKGLKSIVCLAIGLTVFTGCDKALSGLFQDPAERRRTEGAERAAREELARQEREKTERLEHEKQETEKLMTTLPALVDTRIKMLRSKENELTDALKGIAGDRRLAEKAILSIDDRRGLEYTVYNLMTNQDLNTLAVKYVGCDFSALKSEFTEAIRFHKTSHAELTQTLKNNAEEYKKQVKDADKDVDVANQTAQNAVGIAHDNILRRIEKLEIQKRFLLESRVKESDPRLKAVDVQLERLQQLLEVSGGSTAHMNATLLESAARRKVTRAQDEKESKDATAISDSQSKGDLYNAAQIYRGRSIDKLLNAMSTQSNILSERLCAVEASADTLEESKVRLSLMEYPDLVKLRDEVVSDTRAKLGTALTAPVGGK